MINTEALLRQEFRLDHHHTEVTELAFNSAVHLPFGTIDSRPSAWLEVAGTVNGAHTHGAAEGTALPIRIPMYDDHSSNLGQNVDSLVSRLAGRSMTVADAEKLVAEADLGGKFSTARMTVETAVLDMVARGNGVSVYEALSGERPAPVMAIPYGKSIAENSHVALMNAAAVAIDNGAGRLKFKLSPTNLEAVLRTISELQRMFPGQSYMVDANGTFDPEDSAHLAMLERVDQLGLMMIEEPVSRGGRLTGLSAHRALQKVLPLQTPVALDDAISTHADAQIALEEGLGDILNLKPGRVGSFLACVDMAVLAKQRNKQIMVGGMFEATPGRTMTLTLAALCLREGFTIPGDVSLPQERLAEDLIPGDRLRLDANHNVMLRLKQGWGYDV